MLQKELGNGEEGCADNGTDGESNAEEQLQGGTGRKGEKPVHERNVQQEGKDDGGRRLQDDGDDDIGGDAMELALKQARRQAQKEEKPS